MKDGNIIALVCLVLAALLLLAEAPYWGWFILIAVLAAD